MVDIRESGAVGDGKTINTKFIQATIDKVASQGGGTVLVPAGKWLTGSLTLHSHIRLVLDAGATILGSQDPADYPLIEARWEGSTRTTYSPLIGGENLLCVSIEGRGTVDGQGSPWWKWFREKSIQYPRPRLISFTDCDKVLLSGFTAQNSPSWTINPVRCSNVHIQGLSVYNPPDSPNTDGINPDSCRAVRISDCWVSVGDDCITIKSGTEHEAGHLHAPCEDITVSNCVLERGHGGVVIGSEMSGGVRHVAISNCIFKGTDRGIRIKSRRGRGGVVEDIAVSNIIMTDVLSPLTINLYYGCGAWGDPVVGDKNTRPIDDGTPAIRNISLTNIRAKGTKIAAAFIYGLPEQAVENISLRDYNVDMDAGWTEEAAAEMADGLPSMCRHGFWARNVKGLSLSGIQIRNVRGEIFDFDVSVEQTVS